MEKKIITNGNDPIHEVKNANGTTMAGNFDTNEWRNATNPFLGLTKREYFAAMAMQGLFANPEYVKVLRNISEPGRHQSIAETSVAAADALITSLNKPAE